MKARPRPAYPTLAFDAGGVFAALAAPCAVIAAVWLGLPYARLLLPHTVFVALPAVLIIVAAALALAYRHGRMVFVLAIVAAAWLALNVPAAQAPVAEAARALAATLAPLNLAIVFLARERGVLSRPALWRWLLLGTQIALAAGLLATRPQALAAWLHIEVPFVPQLPVTTLPDLALLAFAVAVLIPLAALLRAPGPDAGGFLGCALAMALACGAATTAAAGAYVAAAALVLVFAMLHRSLHLAYRDELTGLPGRRAFNDQIARLGRQYVIAMLDIDHFKKLNDTWGHDVGDQVLKMIATRLRRIGGGGRVFRYGGEEFAIVFDGQRMERALPHLQALRAAVQEYALALRSPARAARDRHRRRSPARGAGQHTVTVTISIGAAVPPAGGGASEDVVKAADQALYRAKDQGRNRVST
ncbi:MAG: GGDEF domain-containing protein [Gammaproteobacteria bacterium]|nr:GGDEF domain-containing protein [Gammaproteobacteria bacterium]